MRVAVLTSGGDAPGMNACVRAVVRAATDRSMDVVGIRRGYEGVFDGDFVPLGRPDIVNIVQAGGTILGTARCARMREPGGPARAARILSEHGVGGVVLIGGDGTFRGGAALQDAGGPPTVGVPGTIDNDIGGTDLTIGFDTAVNTALDALDRIRDTAMSHDLLHFLVVMGRRCGALALTVAVAGGAEAVLVPEIAMPDGLLADRIRASLDAGKRSVIIVMAEGACEGGAAARAQRVADALGRDHRLTVLGHVQRGGPPTACDRTLAAILGVEAVAALADGARGVFIGQRDGRTVRVPYAEAAHGGVLDPRLTGIAAVLA